uniref:Putative secreted protein n=1 Tax=Ixodes ricinus TaxID=34613 RepID=A0A6B0UB65_IXORI
MLLTVDVLIVSFFFLAPVEETEETGRACFPSGERWLLGLSLKCLSGLGVGVGSLVLRGCGPPACVCRLVRAVAYPRLSLATFVRPSHGDEGVEIEKLF